MRARLLIPLLFLAAACGGSESADEAMDMPAETMEAAETITVGGFSSSEAVRHDPEADVYWVANINGEPTEKDDNGFISRVSPDGEVLELKWIDGETGDFTLNAPKGMAIHGPHLVVADIDVVRLFDRATGEHVADWPVEGAQFLNDVAVGDDMTIYVTDTMGMALYLFDGSTPVVMASGEGFGNPNGLDVDDAGVTVVMWNGGVKRVDAQMGETTDLPAPEGARLDGIVLMDDGSYVVSSWDAEAVLRVAADGTITEVMAPVSEAADIGYDATRNRILIPTFSNELHIVPLGG